MAVEGGVSRDHTMLTSSFSCCSRAMRSVSSFSRARIFSISAGQIVAAAPASQPRDQRHGGEEGAGWAATHWHWPCTREEGRAHPHLLPKGPHPCCLADHA